MRVPVSHPALLAAALWLTGATPADDASQSSAWPGLSVSGKLGMIREGVAARKPAPTVERFLLVQSWRNCISGYWRNC